MASDDLIHKLESTTIPVQDLNRNFDTLKEDLDVLQSQVFGTQRFDQLCNSTLTTSVLSSIHSTQSWKNAEGSCRKWR